MPHIVVGLEMAAADANAMDPEDRAKDTEAGTEIAVAGKSTDSRASKVLRLVVRPCHCVKRAVLFEDIVLEREVPSADRERVVLSRAAGMGLHIAIALAHPQTFKVDEG